MYRQLGIALVCLLGSAIVLAQAPRRIDPEGIDGSLIFYGAGNVSDRTIDQFIDLAHGKKARILALDFTSNNKSGFAEKLKKRIENLVEDKPYWHSPADDKPNANQTLLQKLETATGVWLITGEKKTNGDFIESKPFTTALSDLLKRKGVIAIGRNATSNLWRNFLPDALVEISTTANPSNDFKKNLQKRADRFAAHVPPGAALLVRGRRLFALTDSPVNIHLPATKTRPAKRMRLVRRKTAADLTAVRRSLRDRMLGNFPPQTPEPPVVKKGTLIIIGGGGMPKGMIQRIVDLAGGKKAQIVVLPTAIPDPISKRSGLARAFRKAGAKKVTVLPQRRLKDVESKEFLDTLKTATGIWFGGGRQWRFVDAYENTKAHKLMFDVLRRGGVIAGSSAGASIQAEYLARGDPLGNLNIIADGYERGLGFLKGVAIDQHFARRKRFKDMTQLVGRYPQLLGIGIDEATAIIVQKSVAEVTGRGKVYFYDAKRKIEKGQPDYVAVPDGRRYDLKERRILPDNKSETQNPKSETNSKYK